MASLDPARYFPFLGRRYRVTAGLHRLGTDFGNGSRDNKVFQLDRQWPEYQKAKHASRAESLDKYVCSEAFGGPTRRAVVSWIADRLAQEHPEYFSLDRSRCTRPRLGCRLSHQVLEFDEDWLLGRATWNHPAGPGPAYVDAFDALGCQIQEDLAVFEIDGSRRDRLVALHLCFPNHWSAQEKIGKDFVAIHEPVPGFAPLARQSASILEALVARGPFVRFAWGLATDTRLNHHPMPPRQWRNAPDWQGRNFDPADPRLYLRIERQVTVGFPDQSAFLFTIRTYFEEVNRLAPGQLDTLATMIQSMDEQTLRYKGLGGQRDAVVSWVRALASR